MAGITPMTVVLSPTLQRWLDREVNKGIDSMVRTYGLGKAMEDGRVTMDEVELPVDTFRNLSGNTGAITRDSLRVLAQDKPQQTLINAFRTKFAEIERGVVVETATSVDSALEMTGFDITPAGNGVFTLDRLNETGSRHPKQGGPGTPVNYSLTGYGLVNAVFEQFKGYDQNGDGRVQVFSEIADENDLHINGTIIRSGFNPVRTTKDLITLSQGKDSITASDYFNYIVTGELKAKGLLPSDN